MSARPTRGEAGEARWAFFEAARALKRFERTVTNPCTKQEYELLEALRQEVDRKWEEMVVAEKAEEQLADGIDELLLPVRSPDQKWQLYGLVKNGRNPSPNDPLWGIQSVELLYEPNDGGGPCHYPLVCGLYGEDAEVILEAMNRLPMTVEEVIARWDETLVAKKEKP